MRNRMFVVESLKELANYLTKCLPATGVGDEYYETDSPNVTTTVTTNYEDNSVDDQITERNMVIKQKKVIVTDLKKQNDISHHTIKKKRGPARSVKRVCKRCNAISRQYNDRIKVIEVTTYCIDCVGKPHYCMKCFNIVHKIEMSD